MYSLQKISLLVLLLVSGLVLAEPLFPKTGQNLFDDKVSFLPVEQAYQLSVSPHPNGLHLNWAIADGYYLYKHQFAFYSTNQNKLTPTLSYDRQGVEVYDEFFGEKLTVFYNQLGVTADISPSEDFIVRSQACADAGLCYPPRQQKVSFSLDSGQFSVTDMAFAAPKAAQPATPVQAQGLGVVLLFALLGGLILNLMPCVFPVLSIKVLSLTSHHQTARQKVAHGASYAIGVIASFVIVAAVMLILRSAGQAVGWGFQLQSPIVVAALVYLFVLMGLSFSGFFNIGSSWMNFGQDSAQGVSLRSSFLSGVLATVVASPCSAPFMGTALGFALTQSVVVSLLIFATLGVGMALPVFVLAAWPRLAVYMPRPGAWMETLKQLLAYPLYLSAVWLLWVLGRQAGSDTMAAVLVGLILLVLALWLMQARQHRKVAVTFAILCVFGAVLLPIKTYQQSTSQSPATWEDYSQQRLGQLISAGRPVFVNVTADWCITCLVNEKAVLSSNDIKAAFKKQDIVYMKADWTNYDAAITRFLNQHQRSGVPLYLFYSSGEQQPTVLPQILTKSGVISVIGNR